MGRTPLGLNRGMWTRDEDLRLRNYIEANGEGGWRTLPMKAGLLRCGKSCRLRWMNYLRPDVKRGHILPDEEDLIVRLHRLLGNRWSLIAGRIPGRTDNEIKNYWNTHLSKKLIRQGIDPRTHTHFSESRYKGSNPGDRETSQKSQRKNNYTRSIAESRADLQVVPLKGGAIAAHDTRSIAQIRADLQVVPLKGGAIAAHDTRSIAESRVDVQVVPLKGGTIEAHGSQDDETSATWPGNNQFHQTSITCNPRRACVAINFWSQTSAIPSMPYAFQEHTSSTCFPWILSNSAGTDNMGSKQIYFPPLTPCTCFNSSEMLTGVSHHDLDQYLMKNPVTSSNDMLTSTVRLSSGLITAPFATQFESSNAFISGNALLNEKCQMSLQNLQALEMNPRHSFIVHPFGEAAYNNYCHTSCAVPDQITGACSYRYPIIPTVMGAALGNFTSEIFPLLRKSCGNEELQLQEASAHTSVAQNVQLCPLSQPNAENLTGDDLWSMLSPSPHYHPNG